MRVCELMEKISPQTSLAVQWLRLHASNARSTGQVPGGGTDLTCHVVQPRQEASKQPGDGVPVPGVDVKCPLQLPQRLPKERNKKNGNV